MHVGTQEADRVRQAAAVRDGHPASPGPGGARRRRLTDTMRRWWAVLLIAAVVVPVTIATPYEPDSPIRADGFAYHAWTRAFVERDLDFCDLSILQKLNYARREGHCAHKYPPGLALLRLPVMAWFVDTDAPDLVISSEEHEASLWLGAAALLLACGFMLAACLRLGVAPLVANVVVLAACFGTGLFHYATYDGSYSHVYSAALVAALMWLGVRGPRGRGVGWGGAVFAVVFMIVLTRPLDALIVLPLAGGWLAWRALPLEGRDRVRTAVRGGLPVALGLAAAVGLELAYNRWAAGDWALTIYGPGENLELSRLKEGPVLLSYDGGLFTWYPALLVLLVAALLRRSARGFGIVALVSIAALTVVYGSWYSWLLKWGFGHRGFIEVVPVVAVAGAVALKGLRPRLAVPALAVLAVCLLATVQLMVGYWRGTLDGANTDPAEYWSHLGGRESLFR